jgi:cytochrome c553
MMVRLPTAGKALLPLAVFGMAACSNPTPQAGMELGAELFETCAPCHGDAGQGNVDIAAPAIAGLPQWYVEDQLRGFQNEYRGDHASDLPGLRMRPMAVSLTRDVDVPSVSQYVASLDPLYPESTLHGNAGAGAASYAVCVACHGEDGLGNPDLHAPPIVMLDDWYLLNQLRNFKSGARGARPADTWGQTMRVNSLALSDEAMQDVIAYVQTLR